MTVPSASSKIVATDQWPVLIHGLGKLLRDRAANYSGATRRHP